MSLHGGSTLYLSLSVELFVCRVAGRRHGVVEDVVVVDAVERVGGGAQQASLFGQCHLVRAFHLARHRSHKQPQQGLFKPRQKSPVNFSFKVRHLAATILMIFLRTDLPNFVYVRQY